MLIDAGGYSDWKNISAARNRALFAAKVSMLAEIQANLTALNNGLLVVNGGLELKGDTPPSFPNVSWRDNIGAIGAGGFVEWFGAFYFDNPDGSWNATMPGTLTPYPFPVSSSLFPEWALVAYPHVAYEAKLAVVRALLQLNRTSPQAVLARYAAWQLAEVYQGVVNVLDAMQAFVPLSETQSGRQCSLYADNHSDYDTVPCPTGTYKILESEAIQNCRLANLSCPRRACWRAGPLRAERRFPPDVLRLHPHHA
jgi:hypothetical protein